MSKPQLKALEQRMAELKAHFWGDKEIILHSKDIRKHQRGFEILLDPEVKRDFYERVNGTLSGAGNVQRTLLLHRCRNYAHRKSV